MATATRADASITRAMARCRPHRIAASLPRTLEGMARMATRKLTVIGVSTAEPSWRAATNPQKATIQVRMP